MLDDLRMLARYAWGLRGYLHHTLTPDQCRRMLTSGLENRDESFLRIIERGIYANPRSPYRKLLLHAGVEFGDIAQLLHQLGIERTLDRLYDEGVYVTLDEFKGRRPIRRRGLEFPVRPQDFDNPLLAKHYEGRSSGSRSAGTRVIIDLDLLTQEAAYFHYFLTVFNLAERPIGSWREVPPVTAGMKLLLRYAKLGKSVERWFAQSKLPWSPKGLNFALFTKYTCYAGFTGEFRCEGLSCCQRKRVGHLGHLFPIWGRTIHHGKGRGSSQDGEQSRMSLFYGGNRHYRDRLRCSYQS